MNEHDKYIQRCLELAASGLGNVAPNPLVGAVLVKDGKITGEGFHHRFGEAHAEVNAINSFLDSGNQDELSKAILYINLEPCNHHGKTPPCTVEIIKHKIPCIVIGCADPNPFVAGKGIEVLRAAGCEVVTGILEKESRELNRRFITYHTLKRPYIILKFAKSKDGFLAPENFKNKEESWLTNEWSRKLVHKWRSEEQAVMIGTNTAITDDPLLTTRFWSGKNPVRIVIDRKLRLPDSLNIFNDAAPTIVFNELKNEMKDNLKYLKIDFTYPLEEMLHVLYIEEIQSVIIEGGVKLLNSFIKKNLWDEARVFTADKFFIKGIKAPVIPLDAVAKENIDRDELLIFRNTF
ncbi:MAG TPA: bifunctional diaminohydroxyphosphoribosylaminopyrimidine deaminase/5-amino-6-(5-phosphoribosylamino)uracil reductase RibD [Bacteroidia bacterium]|nr:bifunctional diaminohydroxyphosphoribosylaminopyrimidine deaminase/5-amino-6-(5-phosphoribosylamino)uracil reductase RibD [Bacteroidia bacterium]